MKSINQLKASVIFLKLLFLCVSLQAQNVYNSTFKLENYIDDSTGKFIAPPTDCKNEELAEITPKCGDFEDYINILMNFAPSELQNLSGKSFIDSLKESKKYSNPFIGDLLPETTTMSGLGDFAKNTYKNLSSSTNSVGALNISTLADGTAQFLIERSKEELTITFFNRFKDKLEEGTDLSILFPTTALFVEQFQSYEYAAMLNAIREAFIDDLNNLPQSLPLLESNHEDLFSTNSAKLILSSLELVEPLKNGSDLATVIDIAATSAYLSELTSNNNSVKNIQPTLNFVNVISKSLLSEQENKVWVSYSEINDLINDQITFKIYLGLLYELFKKEKITFTRSDNETTELTTLIENTEDDIKAFEELLRDVNTALQPLNSTFSELKSKSNSGTAIDTESISRYTTQVLSFISSFENIQGIIKKPGNNIQWPESEFDSFIKIAKRANSLVLNISQKDYSAAVVELVILIKEGELNINIRQDLIKYGTFIASVAEAESSEEVKAAIEAAVLPAGSSRIKRETLRNISINSYLGAFAGREVLRETEGNQDKASFTFGVSAPIGVAFSWGTRTKCERTEVRPGDNSFSLFISFVDIGAFASYRLQGDEVEELPEFTLQNIIAPGIFGSWNIPNSPLTFSMGGQLGPQLRKIGTTLENSEVINKTSNAWRLHASLTVDIPLFNLKTKPWD